MRVRTKDCDVCKDAKEVLYRCRYQDLKDWVFLCGKCLTGVKSKYNSHTHSIAKKKKIREVRITRFYEPEICCYRIEIVAKICCVKKNKKRTLYEEIIEEIIEEIFT
jgi:hypothetical protein